MSEGQQPPSAAPTTPAAPAAPTRPEPAAVLVQQRRKGHIDRALERARATSTGTPPAAPVDPTAPTEPPAPANAAAAVLAGLTQPAASPPAAETPVDASDARVVESMTKILELERAARAEREQIERDRQALAAEREPLVAWQKAAELKAQGKPLAALEALGLTYEELTVALMRGEGAGGALEPATQQLLELQKQLEEMPKTFEEKLRQAQEEAVSAKVEAYKASVDAGLKADRDRWGLLTDPLVTEGKAPLELIEATMEHHYTSTGAVLTWQDAADMLEAQLEARARERALAPGGKLARILQLSTAAPSAPTSQQPTTTAPSRTPMPAGGTLTPALASETTAGSPPPRTRDDFRRRALDAARQRRGQ